MRRLSKEQILMLHTQLIEETLMAWVLKHQI